MEPAPDAGALIDPAIRRADARFLLPYPVSRAHVLGPDRGWARALALAGLEVTESPGAADLLVAPGSAQREAVASGVAALVLEGRCRARPLRAAGYEVARHLVLPDAARPELVLPVAAGAPSRYAVARRVAGAARGRRALVSLAARALRRAPGLRPGSLVTVATRAPGRPLALQEGRRLGIPSDASWYLLLGSSQELAERRLAFVVFGPGQADPSWVVKLARVPGLEDPFRRDDLGVQALATAAPGLADRAPRILGHATVDDLPLSLETAAVGDRLTEVLRRGGRARRPLVGSIAAWLVDLAVETRRPGAHPSVDEVLLERVVAAVHGGPGVGPTISAALARVPTVLTHGDLGTWNVVSDGRDFTVIDWESARMDGPPLTDLLHLLADACSHMAGRASRRDRPEYVLSLFRGDEALSPFVFRWVRRAVHALDLPGDAVGPLATLTWLVRADLAGPGRPSDSGSPSEQLARRWLEDPALGTGWRTWA